MQDEKAIAEIDFVYANYKCIADQIKELESLFLPADEAIKLVEEVGDALKNNPSIPQKIIERFDDIFTKNPGYVIVRDYLQQGNKI